MLLVFQDLIRSSCLRPDTEGRAPFFSLPSCSPHCFPWNWQEARVLHLSLWGAKTDSILFLRCVLFHHKLGTFISAHPKMNMSHMYTKVGSLGIEKLVCLKQRPLGWCQPLLTRSQKLFARSSQKPRVYMHSCLTVDPSHWCETQTEAASISRIIVIVANRLPSSYRPNH